MARYLSGIRKQLQEVSDLFKLRYGKGSEISEAAFETLASAALLEHNFSLLDGASATVLVSERELVSRAN